jgi:predicted nuclease of predicted toxin-antitoxin system
MRSFPPAGQERGSDSEVVLTTQTKSFEGSQIMPWVEIDIDEKEATDFSRRFKKKARFLVDESLGVEAARVIRAEGWNAIFVSEVGLAGHPDENVFAYAWRDDRVLLTHDHDFLDDRAFPPHRNPGLVVLPGASGPTDILERELARVLVSVGRHREAYRGYKIHIRDDGTWSIRDAYTPAGARHARLLRFERGGPIFELQEDTSD